MSSSGVSTALSPSAGSPMFSRTGVSTALSPSVGSPLSLPRPEELDRERHP